MKNPEIADIIIREGTNSDNDGLVYLTSLTPMKGEISIRVDRKPDFFRLLEKRGVSFVLVAEKNNSLIASFSASAINVYLNGKPEIVYYLGDFKVHPDFQKSPVAASLTKVAMQKLESLNADLIYGTVVVGNNAMKPFLKGGAFWLPAQKTGLFNVYQIIPTPFKTSCIKYQKKEREPSRSVVTFKTSCIKYQLRENSLTAEIIDFFNKFSLNFQLGPVYSTISFKNTTLITASLNNKLVAAIALIDMTEAKQDVLIGLPYYLKCIIKLINAFHFLLPKVRLPQMNESIRILYLKSFAFESGHEEAFKSLMAKARNLAFERKYHFLTVGIHEKNPVKKIFSKYPKFTFKSMLYVASMKNNNEKMNYIIKGITFEDYSLV